MFKKIVVLLSIIVVLVSVTGCAPSAEVVISQPQVIVLIGQSAQYAITEMQTTIEIMNNMFITSPYSLAYTNAAGEYMWATLTRIPEIAGDAAAFTFYSPSGEKDFSQYYSGAKNMLDICSNLVSDGWVRVTADNPLIPAAMAEVLSFFMSLPNVSIFAVPIIVNEDGSIMLPEQLQSQHIDT
jgi:hypothetical protein